MHTNISKRTDLQVTLLSRLEGKITCIRVWKIRTELAESNSRTRWWKVSREFKGHKIYERSKTSTYFHFSYIIYLLRTLLTYYFRKLLSRHRRPLNLQMLAQYIRASGALQGARSSCGLASDSPAAVLLNP